MVVSLTFTAGLNERARGLPPTAAAFVQDAGKTGSGIAPLGAPFDAITAVADAYTVAFHRAMLACAVLAFASGLIALAIIRDPPRGAEEMTAPVVTGD